MAAAAARATHLHMPHDVPIHVDDVAHLLIGVSGPDALLQAMQQWGVPSAARVCAYFALRHRYAEDRLAQAIARGVRQVVLLGAGLDSLALRQPHLAEQVVLVEVDHPDSQRWKLARLEELGRATPSVVYLPVDFATQDLEARLADSPLRLDRPTYFSWLGVTQYIDRRAGAATLGFVARQPAGSEIVFDFIVENDLLAPLERAFSDAAARHSAQRGEPWQTTFDPTELERHLADLGFAGIERLTPGIAASRYYGGQPHDVAPLEAWQLISAQV
jgi:methyltransferase (TIGR00027 family)